MHGTALKDMDKPLAPIADDRNPRNSLCGGRSQAAGRNGTSWIGRLIRPILARAPRSSSARPSSVLGRRSRRRQEKQEGERTARNIHAMIAGCCWAPVFSSIRVGDPNDRDRLFEMKKRRFAGTLDGDFRKHERSRHAPPLCRPWPRTAAGALRQGSNAEESIEPGQRLGNRAPLGLSPSAQASRRKRKWIQQH